MHSSTSSSEFENRYQTLDSTGELKVRMCTFLGGLLVFVLVVGLFNFLARKVPMNDRVLGMIDYLPKLVEDSADSRRVLFFGSSMVQAGFEPELFDRYFSDRDLDVASFNYGVGNLNPEFQQYVTRHIRDELESRDTMFDLTLLEFNPFQTTKRRYALGEMTRDQNQAILWPAGDVWRVALNDPDRAARLLFIRYLRNGLSAELITSAILLDDGEPGAESNPAREAALEKKQELRRAFLDTLPADYDLSRRGWDAETRGGRLRKSELSQESLQALDAFIRSYNNPALLAPDLENRIQTSDILGLDFDERLVQAFIAMVNDLSAVSGMIEIVLLPRNSQWVEYTPEVQARLNAMVVRISNETGVAVRDMQVSNRITPEMFVDTTHLGVTTGAETYTRLLAETYEATLLDAPRGTAADDERARSTPGKTQF
ncbi:MAG: hypothetical protein AAF662_07595 [Pseudomonadota bacterium]